MKEMENVQKKKEQERAADLQERLSTLDKDKDSSENSECKALLKTYSVKRLKMKRKFLNF